MLHGVRRQVARVLRLASRGVEHPRRTASEVSAFVRGAASAGAAPILAPGGEPPRHVAVPLADGPQPGVREDLLESIVDLVVTIDVDDLERRPDVVEELAGLASEATSRGVVVTAVVYQVEESVGRTHVLPRLPEALPLVVPHVMRGWSAGVGQVLPHLTGTRTVVVDSTVKADVRVVLGLADELRGGVALAQAVLRHPNETIVSVGAVFDMPLSAPGSLLGGFPPEDAEALGVVDIMAADRPAFAVRTRYLVVPPATTDVPLAVTALSLSVSARASLSEPGSDRVVAVPLGRVYQAREPARRLDVIAQDLLQVWATLVDGRSPVVLAAAGFRLGTPSVQPAGAVPARVTRPRIERRDGVSVVEGTPRLRWSIKTAAWAGERGDDWGDVFFARDLAEALRGAGQEVVIDNRESSVRPESEHLDDVSLVLRGLDRVPLNPWAMNVLWVISHPDRVSDVELAGYDLRYSAGPRWAQKTARRTSLPIEPLLQATNPSRFHPGPVDPGLSSDVLFVGKTREVFRPVVRDAVEAGLDLSVWGEGWTRFISDEHVRGTFLSNDELAVAYRSARLVLNDHWRDMAREGFISNRLFDAVASGAAVISDEAEGLVDVFGPAVRTYRTVEDLRRLSQHAWVDDVGARASSAAAIANEHSFARRASVLVDDVLRVVTENGRDASRDRR